MLTVLIVLGVIAFLFTIPSPKTEKSAAPAVERHHHVTIVVRPVHIQAQILLIRAQSSLIETKEEAVPARIPEARALINPTTAIERYQAHDPRRPSGRN